MRIADSLVLVLVVQAFVGALPPRLSAQSVIQVSDRLSCHDCSIVLDTVATIGGLLGPGVEFVTSSSIAAVDRLGRLLVAAQPFGTSIAVFNQQGGFLRTVGREGGGPGEFRNITRIDVDDEFIYVFDLAKGRILLDHDFNIVRTDAFRGYVTSSIPLGGGSIAVAAILPTPDAVGHPFHIIAANGETASFGDDGSTYVGGELGKVLGGSTDALWVAEERRNRLTRWGWGPPIKAQLTFDRRSFWFDRDNPEGFSWPRSLIRALRVEGSTIWVVGHAPDPAWTDRHTRSAPIPRVSPTKIYDGWIEVVDASTGATLARRQMDELILGFAAGRETLVLIYEEGDDGVPFIRLARSRLVLPPR